MTRSARTLGASAPSSQPVVQAQQPRGEITPARAIDELTEGNSRFVTNAMRAHDWSNKVVATASAQYPFAAILGCMDSRAPLEIIFDQSIGDIFAVRVAGNVVNDDGLGSLEYAVTMSAKLIVVLGHTGCSAVRGAMQGLEMGNLTGLLAKIRPAVTAAGCSDADDDVCVRRVAEMNVRLGLKQIRDGSPYLAERIDRGQIGLVGALYDVKTGRVTFLGT